MHPTFKDLSNSFSLDIFPLLLFDPILLCWSLKLKLKGLFPQAVMPLFWGLALVLICAQMVRMQAKLGIIGNHRCMDGMLAATLAGSHFPWALLLLVVLCWPCKACMEIFLGMDFVFLRHGWGTFLLVDRFKYVWALCSPSATHGIWSPNTVFCFLRPTNVGPSPTAAADRRVCVRPCSTGFVEQSNQTWETYLKKFLTFLLEWDVWGVHLSSKGFGKFFVYFCWCLADKLATFSLLHQGLHLPVDGAFVWSSKTSNFGVDVFSPTAIQNKTSLEILLTNWNLEWN